MNTKLSFNILRPIIFFLCGLGYLPLQSADDNNTKKVTLIKTLHNNETKSDLKKLINLDVKITLE